MNILFFPCQIKISYFYFGLFFPSRLQKVSSVDVLKNCQHLFHESECTFSASDECVEVDDQEQIAAILHRAHTKRKSAENAAKQLLQRLDRSCGITMAHCTASPWEELSSNSRTAR